MPNLFQVIPQVLGDQEIRNSHFSRVLTGLLCDWHNLQIFFSIADGGCQTFDVNFGFEKKPDLLNTSLCRVLVYYQAVYTDMSVSAGASKTKSL